MTFLHRLQLLKFWKDERAAAAAEFAMVLPLFFIVVLGIFEYSYISYMRSIVLGATQAAARASTLADYSENQSALDTMVRERINSIDKGATVTFSRRSYEDFSAIGKPEDFTDKNGNGIYDAGECFSDVNGDGTWNTDRRRNGNGGAGDVVVYTVKATFADLTPVRVLMGQSDKLRSVTARTVLRNQPFAVESDATTLVCPA